MPPDGSLVCPSLTKDLLVLNLLGMPRLSAKVLARFLTASVEKVRLSPGDRKEYQDQVWEMYKESYRAIGLTAQSPSDLMEFDAWDLFLDDALKPIAFSLAKHTRFGLKGGLSGSDGSPVGKQSIKQWIQSRTKLPGYYAEVSHAVERLSRGAGAPVVCAIWVPKVLGKDIQVMPDGIHYERSIQGIGRVVKMMVGNPQGIPSGDGQACPLPDESTGRTAGSLAEDTSVTEQLSHWGCQLEAD